MADSTGFGSFLGNFFGGFGGLGIGNILLMIVAVVVFLAVVGGIIWFVFYKKQWNLKVEFKLPRSDGRIIGGEWGKGRYDSKRGVVWLKRKGKKKSAMKPFSLGQYIQGDNLLTVVQVGAEDYLPVAPDSYEEVVDDTTGEEAAIINFKTDSSTSKAWKNQFERESKSTYSITNWLKDNAQWLSIGLVIFLWGLQFLLLWMKLSK